MKSIFGKNIIISLFGESHGKYVGVTIHGLPAGIKVNDDFIKSELTRRRPKNDNETKRIEEDNYEFISGIYNGYTNGSPVTVIIPNGDIDDSCYEEGVLRPGSSDYPHYIRSNGFGDLRGSGHFSGRLTTPLVIVGALVKPVLQEKNISISTLISSSLPDNGDTKGFRAKVTVKGLPVGVGEPFFDSVESVLSHILFSVPSVKGVSFGDYDIDTKYGSLVKDELEIEDGKVKVLDNHNGGINGGLTNGNDLIINVSFKPISSIAAHQKSVNIKKMENIDLAIRGRHDQTIENRVPVVLESCVAIALCDLLSSFYGSEWFKWEEL